MYMPMSQTLQDMPLPQTIQIISNEVVQEALGSVSDEVVRINTDPINSNVVVQNIVNNDGEHLNDIGIQVSENDVDTFDADTASDTSFPFSEVLRNNISRQRALDTRESRLDSCERRIVDRERQLSTVAVQDIDLKRRIDQFLARPVDDRGLLVDPDIIGYAYANHPYMWMTISDQIRLNALRLEVHRIKRAIERGDDQPDRQQLPVCPVCFDDLTAENVEAYTPECGHMHCWECVYQIDNNGNGHCSICTRRTLRRENVRRTFFQYRQE